MTSTTEMQIEELEDRIQLYNVPVPYDGGELHNIGWRKKLLNGGACLTQDEHIRRTRDKEFKLPSGLVYGATILALFELIDTEGRPGKAREALEELLLNKDADNFSGIITSTRIRYTSQGPDIVFHDYSYSHMRQQSVDMIRPPWWPMDIFSNRDILQALFGTRRITKFRNALNMRDGNFTYDSLCSDDRVRPRQDAVRVFGFSSFTYHTSAINAAKRVADLGLARGVIVTPSSLHQKNLRRRT